MRFSVAAFVLLSWAAGASAQPTSPTLCPSPQPCKVLILSRDEEEALTGFNKILDTAMQGRPLDLVGAVNYFRDKIRNAPAGTPPEPPKSEPPKPAKP